jgi:3-hydroxymyristoyl/3-hydroxydecanoyl-(acyl carrier protein) dehydratase
MTEYWQDLKLEGKETSGGLVAEARFAPESLWFSGHFPGYPIVPGVALLYLAAEVLRVGTAEGEKVTVKSVRRVRFRQPVRPGESLTVLVLRKRGTARRISVPSPLGGGNGLHGIHPRTPERPGHEH